MATDIRELLEKRILVLDGSMGALLFQKGLEEADYRGERFLDHPIDLKNNPDVLNLSNPDIIAGIHKAYLDAGADIIETNTFTATSIAQSEHALQPFVHEMNVTAAQIARQCVEEAMRRDPSRPRFVAGCMGPMNRTLSIATDVNDPGKRQVTFDEVMQGYYVQAKALVEGGVDLLLPETTFDTLNLKAALFAIQKLFAEGGREVPVMASLFMDLSGRTLSGQTLEAFWNSISHMRLLSVGLNCSFGPDKMTPHLEELSRLAPLYVSAYPNAGLPDKLKDSGFSMTTEELLPYIREWCANGWLNIVGGCCGTTPEYIRGVATIVKDYAPRVPPKIEKYTRLSGLEALTLRPETNFVNIGERTNVTGSPKFAKLILAGDYEAALTIARQQVETGRRSLM